MSRPHHPTPPGSLARARRLRGEPTDAETRLWRLLRSRQLAGWKFRRQAPIGGFVVDFLCFEARLVVEADGGQHAGSATDERRTRWLESQGFRIARYWNNDILANSEGVLADLLDRLQKPSPLAGEGGRRHKPPVG